MDHRDSMRAPSSGWPHHYGPDWSIMMGRILERTETTVRRLDVIDGRLENGDRRMTELSRRIASLRPATDSVGRWERIIKGLLPFLIIGGTLAGTVPAQVAGKLLKAIEMLK